MFKYKHIVTSIPEDHADSDKKYLIYRDEYRLCDVKWGEEYHFFRSEEVKQLLRNLDVEEVILRYISIFRCIKKYRLYKTISYRYEYISKHRVYSAIDKLIKAGKILQTDSFSVLVRDEDKFKQLRVHIGISLKLEMNVERVRNNDAAKIIYPSVSFLRKEKIDNIL